MNWFGVVRWCDADIVSALKDEGLAVTDDNVSRVRHQLEHHSFTDVMIERGWDHIHTIIGMMNLEETRHDLQTDDGTHSENRSGV